jgi:hypothetical protein
VTRRIGRRRRAWGADELLHLAPGRTRWPGRGAR